MVELPKASAQRPSGPAVLAATPHIGLTSNQLVQYGIQQFFVRTVATHGSAFDTRRQVNDADKFSTVSATGIEPYVFVVEQQST